MHYVILPRLSFTNEFNQLQSIPYKHNQDCIITEGILYFYLKYQSIKKISKQTKKD